MIVSLLLYFRFYIQNINRCCLNVYNKLIENEITKQQHEQKLELKINRQKNWKYMIDIFEKNKIKLFLLFILLFNYSMYSQNDSLLTTNKQTIIGELKGLKTGVLTIETDYSDKDFNIEWLKVKEIYTHGDFIVFLAEGRRVVGTLTTRDGEVEIHTLSSIIKTTINNVVLIQPLDKTIWEKLSASIDFGLNITKANNLKQLNIRSNLGYLEDAWSTSFSYDRVSSAQDSIESTSRTDANYTFNYFLGKKWYLFVSLGYLQNTEQKLDSRYQPMIGAGNYFIQTNSLYLSFAAGTAFNSEKFTDSETEDKKSGELFLGVELNLFDLGDFSLLTNIMVFKNLNDNKRYRADFKFDMKYDLPLDFYIKLGYTVNYDTEPTKGASKSDYVLQTTFGWEL